MVTISIGRDELVRRIKEDESNAFRFWRGIMSGRIQVYEDGDDHYLLTFPGGLDTYDPITEEDKSASLAAWRAKKGSAEHEAMDPEAEKERLKREWRRRRK